MADYNRNQGGSNRNSNQEWNENRGRSNRNQDNDQSWNSGNQNSGSSNSSESDWGQSRSQSRHQRDDYGQGDSYSSGRYGRHYESDFNSGNFGTDRNSGSNYGGSQGYNSGGQYGSGGSGYYGSGSSGSNDRNLYDRDYQGAGRSGYSNSGTRMGGSNYGGSGTYGDRDRSYYRGNENYGGNQGNMSHRERDNDRNWFDRASDEVSSWFGDDDAERRRERDKQLSHRGKGPKNYNRSDDRIKEDINDKLSDDPFIDASDIDVTVSSGEVTLTGTVDHRSTKRRAEDLAEAVSGVKHVENRIRVGSTASQVSGSTGSSSMSGTTGTTSGTTTGTDSSSTTDRSRTAKRDYVTG